MLYNHVLTTELSVRSISKPKIELVNTSKPEAEFELAFKNAALSVSACKSLTIVDSRHAIAYSG